MTEAWKGGPHQLTYRQVERTFGLVADALAKDDPDGAPAEALSRACDCWQKHDYPSPAHRRSYARRTGSERTFSTIKDTATTNIARGWCRLTGLPPLHL